MNITTLKQSVELSIVGTCLGVASIVGACLAVATPLFTSAKQKDEVLLLVFGRGNVQCGVHFEECVECAIDIYKTI
ncbi:hypothetical protein H5410_027536 [Solanum commersonii]|uniref:Uncharacterized protein n=1 Tax=Solanum commersonii TaxID=4109 RepID=A0A9J5Z3M7_SOLCO|nr:hypothetical protein H5410_027536 [Solanum commersonii]